MDQIWTDSVWSNVIAAIIYAGLAAIAAFIFNFLNSKAGKKKIELESRGGRGGNATVLGNGTAIGGKGGGGGPGGRGGDGGGGILMGDGNAMGGEGGEAGQKDRGGRGGKSAAEILGIPNFQLSDGSWLWDRGKGGDGAPPFKEDKD